MRISDWSSDVCSSDLMAGKAGRGGVKAASCARRIGDYMRDAGWLCDGATAPVSWCMADVAELRTSACRAIVRRHVFAEGLRLYDVEARVDAPVVLALQEPIDAAFVSTQVEIDRAW